MKEKQMKNYIFGLYRYKKISDEQFRSAVNILEKFHDEDPFFYYFNLGRLNTAFGNVEDAIFYLEKATLLKPDYSATYYNLYKCYVKLKNINMSQIYFKKFIETNKSDVNFDLIINIMNVINLIDKDFLSYIKFNFSVEYNSKCGYNDLNNNSELKEIYFEVLKAFNTKDYLTSIKKLKLMNSKINKIAYPMEVDTLIQLINCLKDKEIEYYTMYLKDNEYKEISNEVYINILFRLYELGYYSPTSFLRKVEEIILNDSYVRGTIILDRISIDKEFNCYQDMIKYLRGIIEEQKSFLQLSDEKQKDFVVKELAAKKLYKEKQYESCLEVYLALKSEFNLPICDYYVGKIMYKMRDFEAAKNYFLSYLEQGGVKTEKAYLYLSKIEKNNDNSKRYINMMNRINQIFLRDFEYLYNYKYRKKLNYIDSIKIDGMKTIEMQEEDFKIEETLTINDFNDVDIEGKLIIITNLLRCGDLKNAKKLFEKVQQECSAQDQPKIKQFQKNKKIYINQIRNN